MIIWERFLYLAVLKTAATHLGNELFAEVKSVKTNNILSRL